MSEAFNITGLFLDAAKADPLRAAIIFKDKSISFGELDTRVRDTACYFLKKGIKKNDRVLVFVPMSIDLYRIVLAIFRLGAVAVFLDEWVSKKRMEACCKIAQCKAFIGIFKARALSVFSPELRKIPIRLGTAYATGAACKEFPVTAKDDIALITFTTGSTGIPKAALRSHGFLNSQFNALKEKLEPETDMVSMTVLPIVLLINLASGATSVIASYNSRKPGRLRPEKIIAQIKAYSVNNIIASPFFVKKLSGHVINSEISLPGLKKIFTGGAPVFPCEAAIYNKAFPGANTEVVYGSTEAEPISSVNTRILVAEENNVDKGLCVGKIAKGTWVKIIRISAENIFLTSEQELEKLTLPSNQVGEIIASGEHILQRYLNNEEALKRNKIFIGNKCWHRTGDSGYLDEHGTLFLTGRCDTLIEKDGKIFYPFIYENQLQTVSGVETGTVMLVNGKLTAIVEVKNASEKNAIKNNVLEKCPNVAGIIFLNKIPRDPRHNSKIDYQKLSSVLNGNIS